MMAGVMLDGGLCFVFEYRLNRFQSLSRQALHDRIENIFFGCESEIIAVNGSFKHDISLGDGNNRLLIRKYLVRSK